MYSSVLSRVLGDYADPSEAVPRTARPELRPSRYMAYKTALHRRMGAVRAWWLLRGVLVCIAGAAKLVAALDTHVPGWRSPAAWLLPLLGSAPLAPSPTAAAAAAAAGDFSPSHPFLRWYSAPVALGVHRAGSVLYESLLRDHLGHPSPMPAASVSWNLNLARAVAAAVSATVIPLALGVLAAFTLCRWSARDFASHRVSAEQAEWRWGLGTVGEHPAQALPQRLRSGSGGSAQGGGTARTAAMRRASAAAAATSAPASRVPHLGLPAPLPAEPAAGAAATPLQQYLQAGVLPPAPAPPLCSPRLAGESVCRESMCRESMCRVLAGTRRLHPR